MSAGEEPRIAEHIKRDFIRIYKSETNYNNLT